MRDTELPLEPIHDEKRRARLTRIVAIALAMLVLPFVAVIGGKRLGWVTAAVDESVQGRLDAARDAMRRQAWDAPPDDNVKDILDKALTKWPKDKRVLELRREAAERLVTSALGRKYAGDTGEALHLARIAVSLHPSLTTAHHLVAELEGTSAPDTSVTSPRSESSTAPGASTMGGRPPPLEDP